VDRKENAATTDKLELFKFFLLIGSTGFGGPLSLVQLMREHYVDRRQLISQQDFDQVFTMIKAMPGPIAFQMAVYLGRHFLGFWGALLAGFGLIFPPFVMILLIGIFYQSFAGGHAIQFVLKGFLYSVSAIILISLRSMVVSAYKSLIFWIVIFISFYFSWKSLLPEPLVIIGFGALVALSQSSKIAKRHAFFSAAFLIVDWEKLYPLFKISLYAGTFVFGTGLAILPVLRTQFVEIHQWIPLEVFNDGVIFGQMTPGPVTITASFLGYSISGLAGALAATIGIFLMPFIHMVSWFPYAVKWLAKQNWIKPFLLGATSAVIGTILDTIVKMNAESYKVSMFWIIAVGTFALLLWKPKTPLLAVIFGSGILNFVVNLLLLKTL
jgi:chromate transporter